MATLSSLVPTGYVLTSGASSQMLWTNILSVSTVNASTSAVSSLTGNSISVNTLAASTMSVSTITANSVGYSTLSGSTINATRLNYSSIVGSSISSNVLTLSLTNASTQNTQIYQVATTNPTTSYTVIQASHVSTGTTNNALVLNPSGGNVGIGTTAPSEKLQVNGNIYMGSGYRNLSLSGGNSNGYLYGCYDKYADMIHIGYNFYNNNTSNVIPNTAAATSRLSLGFGTIAMYTGGVNSEPTNLGVYQRSDGNVGINTTNPLCQLYQNGGAGTTGWAGQTYIGNTTRGVILGTFNNVAQIGGHTAALGAWADLSINSGGGSVGIGTTTPSATLQVNGSLAKSSGTFDIEHPLHIGTDKRLVHSFIEGPRCDLIYRGKTTLINGSVVVNIDKECTQSPECAMDNGTFEALCDNPQVFLQNNKTFDRVCGVVSGATLTITCETPAEVEIEWMVIAERADPFIKQWNRTNPDGYLVTQYDAPAAPSPSSGEEVAPSDPADPAAPSDPVAPAASSE